MEVTIDCCGHYLFAGLPTHALLATELTNTLGIIAISYYFAYLLFLACEAPIANFYKHVFEKTGAKQVEDTTALEYHNGPKPPPPTITVIFHKDAIGGSAT